MDDFDLTGRVAIITGGNSGIGLGMADALARAGCAVSIWGRNPGEEHARVRAAAGPRRRSRYEAVRRQRSQSS